MPEVRSHLEGDAPGVPHLAVLYSEQGDWLALPPGATMSIIEDPNRADKIFIMVLEKVSLKKLVFRCRCSDPGCNVRYHYGITKSGQHRAAKRNVAYSSGEAAGDAPAAPSPKTGSR